MFFFILLFPVNIEIGGRRIFHPVSTSFQYLGNSRNISKYPVCYSLAGFGGKKNSCYETVKRVQIISSGFLEICTGKFRRRLTLVMMGGASVPPPHSSFIFLLKISPPDQTLRPTCKFLILGILYFFF